jgi:hypothetical protein
VVVSMPGSTEVDEEGEAATPLGGTTTSEAAKVPVVTPTLGSTEEDKEGEAAIPAGVQQPPRPPRPQWLHQNQIPQ